MKLSINEKRLIEIIVRKELKNEGYFINKFKKEMTNIEIKSTKKYIKDLKNLLNKVIYEKELLL